MHDRTDRFMITKNAAINLILAVFVKEMETYLPKYIIAILRSHPNQTGQKERRSSSTALHMSLHITFIMQL